MLDYAKPNLVLSAPRWLAWYLWLLPLVTGMVNSVMILRLMLIDSVYVFPVYVGIALLPYLEAMKVAAWCGRYAPWPIFNSYFSAISTLVFCGCSCLIVWNAGSFANSTVGVRLLLMFLFVSQLVYLWINAYVLTTACRMHERRLDRIRPASE